jgi:hypothetical protein
MRRVTGKIRRAAVAATFPALAILNTQAGALP